MVSRWFSHADGAALMAVFLWGIHVPLMKIALSQINVLAFVTVRAILASALILVALAVLEGDIKVETSDLRPLAILGVMGVGLTQVNFALGLSYTLASHSALLVTTSPIFATFLATWVEGDRPKATRWYGILLSLLGIWLLVGSGAAVLGPRILLGDTITLVSAILWAGYTVLSKRFLTIYSPLKVTTYALVFSNVALVPLGIRYVIAQDWRAVSPEAWSALAFSVVLGIVVANILWLKSVIQIGITKTILYQYMVPVVTILVASVLLKEHLTVHQIVGAGIVLAGTALAAQ